MTAAELLDAAATRGTHTHRGVRVALLPSGVWTVTGPDRRVRIVDVLEARRLLPGMLEAAALVERVHADVAAERAAAVGAL